MKEIVIVLGLVYFIDALFEKFNIWGWIILKAMKSYRIIYDLSCCRFCMMFHIGWIITLIYGTITGLNLELVFVPFVVSGLTKIIDKR